MDGGCRKSATKKVPGVRLQGSWLQSVTGNPHLDRPTSALSNDQKESMQGGAKEVAGGKQGTSESEECAGEGGRMFNMDGHSPVRYTVPHSKEQENLARPPRKEVRGLLIYLRTSEPSGKGGGGGGGADGGWNAAALA